MSARGAHPASESHLAIRAAVRILQEALTASQSGDAGPWAFAIDLLSLRANAVSDSAIRWLVQNQYVEHAVERTRLGDAARSFRKVQNLSLHARSCFILTAQGKDFAAQVLQEAGHKLASTQEIMSVSDEEMPRHEHPHWDESVHTLVWNGRVLKHFRFEAPHQEAILQAFEAAQWPPCVSVTLPIDDGISPKERLHDTIKNLNRSVRPYLHFRQEGCGTRVRWESSTPT